MVQKAALGY